MLPKFFRKLGLTLCLLGLTTQAPWADDQPAQVSVIWTELGQVKPQILKSWKLSDMATFKVKPSLDSKGAHWNGVLLSDLIQKGLETLPSEKKATVDLVLIHSSGGQKLLIPRYAIVKYPILLGFERVGTSRLTHPKGEYSLLVSDTVSGKMQKESLPVQNYNDFRVSEIELANYQSRFGTYFLKRRTDPAAMRGEKLFVQSCLACHATGHDGGFKQVAETRKHPAIGGVPHFNERDWRSLGSYFDAYAFENPKMSAAKR